MSNIEIVNNFMNELHDFELNKETLEIVNARKDILTERESDKKRIKELEEENVTLRKANNITKDLTKEVKMEYITQVMNKSYEEFMSQFISKQKVKHLIENETINISGFECIPVEDIQELLEEK